MEIIGFGENRIEEIYSYLTFKVERDPISHFKQTL